MQPIQLAPLATLRFPLFLNSLFADDCRKYGLNTGMTTAACTANCDPGEIPCGVCLSALAPLVTCPLRMHERAA